LLSLDKTSADLVILDMFMPGMDGATFVRILRADSRKANIQVVVVTAYDVESNTRQLRAPGVDIILKVLLLLPKTDVIRAMGYSTNHACEGRQTRPRLGV